MEEYRFERLSQDNLFNLVYLYKDCFDLKVDLAFLKKKYNTISFGAEHIGFLAFHNGKNELAGYYGVFPILGQINNSKVLIAQSGDTMTHPNHQGKGLFTHLARVTYELAKHEGIDFVFGFPNKNSFPGFKKKLDWQFYNDINNYTIKTGALPFDKLFKKFNFFEGAYKKWITWKLKGYTVNEFFENSLSGQNPKSGTVMHDLNFFRYKVFYESCVIKIESTLCSVKIDGRLWVGDVQFCSSEQFLKVVDGLIRLAKKIGCSAVHFSVTSGTLYDAILNEKFEVKSKSPIGYLSLNGQVNPSEFAYQAIDFDTY